MIGTSSSLETIRKDDETCFMWMRHRYYDARHRGFLSRDPLEDDVLGNLYAFGGNNPGTFVDPMGLAEVEQGLRIAPFLEPESETGEPKGRRRGARIELRSEQKTAKEKREYKRMKVSVGKYAPYAGEGGLKAAGGSTVIEVRSTSAEYLSKVRIKIEIRKIDAKDCNNKPCPKYKIKALEIHITPTILLDDVKLGEGIYLTPDGKGGFEYTTKPKAGSKRIGLEDSLDHEFEHVENHQKEFIKAVTEFIEGLPDEIDCHSKELQLPRFKPDGTLIPKDDRLTRGELELYLEKNILKMLDKTHLDERKSEQSVRKHQYESLP